MTFTNRLPAFPFNSCFKLSFQLIFTIVSLAFTSVLAYHDPDLNYHISQVQKQQNCGDGGYSYPAPAVQLSTTGIKVAAPIVTQSVVSAPATYQYSSNAGYSSAGYANAGYSNAGYSAGAAYQAVAPKITYATQPATTYQTSSLSSLSNYAAASASNEIHGYATSAGLSTVAAPQRTVTPQATYAQAPIIAKVTAAPLIAKFSLSPPKTTYVTQNLVQQQAIATSAAKASLNSYTTAQSGGPVVSQVYAAPSGGYATSPALRVQPAPVRYTYSAPTVAQYHQQNSAPIAPAAQLGASVTQYATSNAASASQYFSPQYSTQVQYAAPVVAQYAAPQVASVTQYAAPPAPVAHVAAAPSAVQYSVPTTYTQYSSPAVQYSTSGSSAHYASSGASSAQYIASGASVQYAAAPAVAHITAPAPRIAAAPVSVKNVHTDFLENYVSVLIFHY